MAPRVSLLPCSGAALAVGPFTRLKFLDALEYMQGHEPAGTHLLQRACARRCPPFTAESTYALAPCCCQPVTLPADKLPWQQPKMPSALAAADMLCTHVRTHMHVNSYSPLAWVAVFSPAGLLALPFA